MRKNITRTITTTSISSVNVSVGGDKKIEENPILIVNGVISKEKALKEVRKVYGENSLIVAVLVSKATYEISVEDFMLHSKIVTVEE